MRHYITLIIIALLVFSCGNDTAKTIDAIIASKDIKEIQSKKDELVSQQQNIANQIKQLDSELKVLSPDRNTPLITTIKAKSEEFKHYLELQGNVATKQNIVITPEISGILLRVFVKEGQKVTKGQILGSIDDNGLGQEKAQLQVQVNLAKTTYERQKRLWDQNIGSEIQFLQTKSQYETLQKSISQLDQLLAKTNIRAPFSGVVDDVITEQGNVVAAGQTQLIRIVNLSDMYIETDVPESYITSVTNNKTVEVEFPILGKKVTTKVRQTGNFINPANRTFKIEITVPNKDKSIKPNLTARLKINDYTNPNAILIPQSIISENANGEQFIYVIENKEGNKAYAKQIIIKTGKTQGDVIEVLDGLEDNIEIIREGARSVKDGQIVKIIA